jgi:hypothetical protein
MSADGHRVLEASSFCLAPRVPETLDGRADLLLKLVVLDN